MTDGPTTAAPSQTGSSAGTSAGIEPNRAEPAREIGPPAATPRTDGDPTPRPRARGASARVRIMAWLVLVMASGLITIVLVVRQLLLNNIDQQVTRVLAQESQEYAAFAAAGRDRAGSIITEPDELLDLYLGAQYPDEYETLIGVTEGPNGLDASRQAHESMRDVPLSDELLRSIIDTPAGSGSVEIAAGELRWLKVGTRGPAAADTDPVDAWFITGYLVEPSLQETDATLRALTIIGAGALLSGAGICWLVAGQILAPVREVRLAAAALTERDLTHRLPVHGRDDIAALTEQFNAMLDRLERAFRTQREFLDDASHELRTPITIVRGHLELLGDDPVERAEVIRVCTDELDRMSRMVDDLLLLARSEQPDFVTPSWTSIPELSSDIDNKLRSLADRRWILESIGEGEAWIDPQRTTQAVLQLAQNAAAHTEPGSAIRFGSALTEETASFWITDTGPGVRAEHAERIFQRFARGAGEHRAGGAGLGLAIVKAIADAHHGSAHLVSQPGHGATFGLSLPAKPYEEPGAQPPHDEGDRR
ncbi:sensor histidine kinase [Actinoalloteichus hymeniacidonis]|nr:HAMP domain-containing sensor histidine kinase [Actinoalloteichus hymeniacidonis]MBB5907469.1 signal transduction histidine kinase [Actinoalloteichus hymeniacidonis]